MKKKQASDAYPKFEYEKEDDVLNVWLSRESIDYAEQAQDVIIHFTKKNRPVYIEILDASKFLKKASQDLPNEIKQNFFSGA